MHRAMQNREGTAVGSEVVGDLTVVHSVEDGEVGVFAGFDGTLAILQSQGPGPVDCSSGNGLGRRQLHVGTGQRQHKWHAGRGRGAGIVVGGERDGDAGIDQSAGGRKFLQPEKIIRAGNQGGDGVTLSQTPEVAVVYMVHVIERCGVEAQQRRKRRLAELANVSADSEAVPRSNLKDSFCVGRGEGSTVGENIDELSKFALRGFGDHPVANFPHVIGRAALKLIRHNMRAQ